MKYVPNDDSVHTAVDDALAAIQLNRLARRSSACANHPRAYHGNIRVGFPEIEQHGEPVGFRGLALKLCHLQFQRVVLLPKPLVFLRGIPQSEVVTPGVAKPAEAVGTGAFEWRNRADGPDADEASLSLRVALDLYCQQDDLQHDDSREQDQRFVARGNGDHLFVTRDSRFATREE